MPSRRHRVRAPAAGLVLAGVLVAGLILRVWGVQHGLPAVYNVDERGHFVNLAVQYFNGSYNPHYFQNPPGFSYLLHAIYALWFWIGGTSPADLGNELERQLRTDGTELYTIGRVTAGVLGLATSVAVYFVGRRLYGVAAGLVAATLMTLTFLPVHYSHQALNDVPTLLPLVIGLYGVVLVYERGSWFAYGLAGAGLGVATDIKYTAAALAVPLALAWFLRARADRSLMKPELKRLIAAGAISLGFFFLFNPYALLSPREFGYYLHRQQEYSGAIGKLGLDETTGWQYYAWTLTWGFGWVALALSAVGTYFAARRDWRRLLLLVSFLFVFWLFMGVQTRFYARWFLPAYPFLAILAGYGVVRLAALARPRLRTVVATVIVAGALVQPLVHVVHNDRVLTRTDTRVLAHRWLQEHLPTGRRIVLERIASPGFIRTREDSLAQPLWETFRPYKVVPEQYVAHLRPRMLENYARQGFCTVVTGSTQRGRAFNNPDKVPRAIQYYRRLDAKAVRVARFSPAGGGAAPPKFNFDMSFDYYPMAYERPGPLIEIYRLKNGFCAGQPELAGETGARKRLPYTDAAIRAYDRQRAQAERPPQKLPARQLPELPQR
jgi:hypothetical protein